MSYDQWKTASPYDDEPDFIEEAESWLKTHEDMVDTLDGDDPIFCAYWIMKGLLDYVNENT